MRNWDSPYLTDWFAISLRWLILFGITVAIGSAKALNFLIITLLSLSVLWSGFVAIIAIFNTRLAAHRMLNVVVDSIAGLALFFFTGGIFGPVNWAALLPITLAAVYFETRGAIATLLIITSLQMGILSLRYPLSETWVPALSVAAFNAAAAVIVTAATLPFLRRLRRTYRAFENKRLEGERNAQRLERERMRALFGMIETFSATLNYQTVLDTALETGIASITNSHENGNPLAGAVLLFGEHNLEIKASRHFFQRDLLISLPAEQGALPEALKRGEAYLIESPALDPELGQLLTLANRQVALCLPLIRGMNAYGIMLFAHSDPRFFTQERIEVLQMISNQAVIALQNARLYQDLAKEKERIVQTQEEAQKKLARDLHDGPAQAVSAVAMRINIARKMLERPLKETQLKEMEEVMDELGKIEDLARRTTQEIRHMLFTLRPLILESEGLQAALQTMAEKMRDLYQQTVILELDPLVVQQLDAPRQTVVFYLTEEALNNARKYANAPEIRVCLKFLPNDNCIAVLEISDNGIGFDVQGVLGSYERRGSLGMVNLRERANMVNGLLTIESAPGKGTRVRVLIPLTVEAADRLHQGQVKVVERG